MRLGLVACVAAAFAATPAQAEWLRASSRHFVIYSDTTPQSLTNLATRLERFDGALRAIHGMADPPEAASNPVTIYVVDTVSDIQKLARNSMAAGFYEGRASGSVAFTPRWSDGGGAGALSPQIVLFHEYAHHFLLSVSAMAYPQWYSEGYAEFASTARFEADGVWLGEGAGHRAWGLFADSKLPLKTLFAPGRLGGMQMDQLYGRGWLLTHYLMTDNGRRKQLHDYLAKFNAGVKPLDAATQAFGDLDELDRALARYLRGRKLPMFPIRNDRLPSPTIAVRPLTAGERALIDLRVVSTRGVDEKGAASLYARAKRADVPADDAVAQGWLAEMAFDAGDDEGAEAAATRALAADPKSIQALLYKGYVRLRRAAKAESADPKVWAEARSWIVRANRADPNNAGALAAYHASFEPQGAKPSAAAVAGAQRALVLAPQDDGLRFAVARQHLLDGKLAEARVVLRPLAFDPHLGPENGAQRLLAMLDEGKTGDAALAALEAERKAAGEKGKK